MFTLRSQPSHDDLTLELCSNAAIAASTSSVRMPVLHRKWPRVTIMRLSAITRA